MAGLSPSSAHSPAHLPAGGRDHLPREAARRRALADRLLDAFSAWGYERLMTPLFERADVLERGLGDGARAAAIRFIDPGSGAVVALRPDITPQIARVAATRLGDVEGPLRLAYEGAVTRIGGGLRGRREILQAGVELVGAGAALADAEMVALAATALEMTAISERRIDLGHVALVESALGQVPRTGQRRELRAALGRKDRAGVAEAARGLDASSARLCEALPTLFGPARPILSRARKLPLPPAAHRALDRLEQILALAAEMIDSRDHGRISIDLGEVQSSEYYTGVRLAGYIAGAGEAVLRGGRYDELLGRYGRPAPATGFAVDIEAIAEAQAELGVEGPAPVRGILISAPPPRHGDALRLAALLRECGFRAAVDLSPSRSLSAVRGYARKVGFSTILQLRGAGCRAISAVGDQSASLSAAELRHALSGRTEILDRITFGSTSW